MKQWRGLLTVWGHYAFLFGTVAAALVAIWIYKHTSWPPTDQDWHAIGVNIVIAVVFALISPAPMVAIVAVFWLLTPRERRAQARAVNVVLETGTPGERRAKADRYHAWIKAGAGAQGLGTFAAFVIGSGGVGLAAWAQRTPYRLISDGVCAVLVGLAFWLLFRGFRAEAAWRQANPFESWLRRPDDL